jgi:CrcB protein
MDLFSTGMIKTLIIIGTGGFIGSVARYLLAGYITKQYAPVFPLGTMIVNIAGCLLIGVFYALAERSNVFTPEWRIFLTTGFCGGFTTFSTFSFESIKLLETGAFLGASLNVAISVVAGFAATSLGILLVKSI